MNKIKNIIVALTVMFTSALAVALPVYAYTCPSDMDEITCGVCQTNPSGPGCDGSDVDPSAGVNELVEDIINIFSWIVGVISVIMIIFGGFKYITSGGDAGKVTSAKNTILYAVVGLIIAALAQVIVLFVLGNATT